MIKCNLCGGNVEYIPNSMIYGKSYGSGWCYRCSQCKAFVGTHKTNPLKPLGVLADKEMRILRMKCHKILDSTWKTPNERTKAYDDLAVRLGYEKGDCHFSWMSKEELKTALAVLEEEYDS